MRRRARLIKRPQGAARAESPGLPPDQNAPGNPGTDGALARTVYLAPEPSGTGDPELLKRRAALERQLDELRTRKASSPNPGQLDADIERLLIEIAQLSRQLRDKR